MDFGLTAKNRGRMAQKWARKLICGPCFCISGPFFAVRPESIFRRLFYILGRRPEPIFSHWQLRACSQIYLIFGRFSAYELPNLWFPCACGWHFTKMMEITKMTKTAQTATNKELSAGLAEVTDTTEMTETTGIRGANHGFPKPRV